MEKLFASLMSFVIAISCWALAGKSEAYLRDRVVLVTGGGISCTGEQVQAPSGVSYILTAGHCNEAIVDGTIEVTTERGAKLERRVIAEDPTSDLLLVEGLPNLPGLPLATDVETQEHVLTLTHGGRKPTYRTDGVVVGKENIQSPVSLITDDAECLKLGPEYAVFTVEELGIKVCVLSVEETITTAQIIPGSSGGPVMNDSGELVGVASMGDGFFGYMVKLSDIRAFLAGY